MACNHIQLIYTGCPLKPWNDPLSSVPQVNFYHDHTKLILWAEEQGYMLTYINEDRISTTLKLSALLSSGCSSDLRERMEYALNMLMQRSN